MTIKFLQEHTRLRFIFSCFVHWACWTSSAKVLYLWIWKLTKCHSHITWHQSTYRSFQLSNNTLSISQLMNSTSASVHFHRTERPTNGTYNCPYTDAGTHNMHTRKQKCVTV